MKEHTSGSFQKQITTFNPGFSTFRNTLDRYYQIYQTELYENVLPFWLKNSLDYEYGGYFNCLDEDGNVYDTRKHCWLQGRQVWMMSKIHNRNHGLRSPVAKQTEIDPISNSGVST